LIIAHACAYTTFDRTVKKIFCIVRTAEKLCSRFGEDRFISRSTDAGHWNISWFVETGKNL